MGWEDVDRTVTDGGLVGTVGQALAAREELVGSFKTDMQQATLAGVETGFNVAQRICFASLFNFLLPRRNGKTTKPVQHLARALLYHRP